MPGKPAALEPLSSDGPAMELARSLYQQGQELTSFAARGSVNYIDGNQRHFFRFEFILSRPGGLSFTVLDPLGRPALRVVSDWSRFYALDYLELLATVGLATDENLRAVIPINLEIDDLLAVMTNALMVNPVAAAADRFKGGSIGVLRVAADRPQPGSVWLVSLDNLSSGPVISSCELKKMAGGDDFRVRYNRFTSLAVESQPPGSKDFPMSIEATVGRETTFEIRFDDVRLGPSLPAELFIFQVPGGFAVQEI
ncbi:MAG: DUF4292 domain-containing protein [Deltaproteobacteria bacterium]|nr:DUF4292 domain-containing protein [Deltaproteobacteria bacterium]